MKAIFIPLIIILAGITGLQAQVSDSSKRTQSRRPTINQSQARPSQKELRELELNRNRDKGTQVDTTTATGENSRKQPTENRALRNESNQAGDDNPKSPANTNEVSIFETGSSSAGSPSTISDNEGKGRDGTNNVQRSTPNMAGSPPPRRGSMKASNASSTSGSDRATKDSKEKDKAEMKEDAKSSKDKNKDVKKKDDKKKDKSKKEGDKDKREKDRD